MRVAVMGQKPPLAFNTVAELTKSQMSLLKREAVEVFEAMKMESAFVDWLKEKEPVLHNDYRVLFRAGGFEPLMEFLTRGSRCTKINDMLAALTHIPIEKLRSWGNKSPQRSQRSAIFAASN
jgi:hypothetical protein